MTEKTKKILVAVVAVVASLLALTILWFGYVSDYYHTDEVIQENLNVVPGDVQVLSSQDCLVYEPTQIKAGLIFYPGAKVEYTAYAPIMKKLASEGILTILVRMPQNLAFFGIDYANTVMGWYPEVEDWYLCGHSLGGSAAGFYASNNADKLKGVIFWASYTINDLNGAGLATLSIYGSEDHVLNLDSYRKNQKNLPNNTEVMIEGGNHANFGAYGEQFGDGTATITREEQWNQTAKLMKDFILN